MYKWMCSLAVGGISFEKNKKNCIYISGKVLFPQQNGRSLSSPPFLNPSAGEGYRVSADPVDDRIRPISKVPS